MKAEAKPYPKRLIEVDLPIRRISEHARREKSIRHGHISTLHIWWARRPLAACRAVICASLWPDPADPNCPVHFRDAAKKEMLEWANHERLQMLSRESQERFNAARKQPGLFDDSIELRRALLDFIADFSNWDNSTHSDFLATSKTLTGIAHEAVGGAPGTRPLVVDPFAGGGAIPLEALRVGSLAFASDLNPLPILLNKVVLEHIPRYGRKLADEFRKWGDAICKDAQNALSKHFPAGSEDSLPIAYLWARTIQCQGPTCGAEVPLIRSLWLSKKANRSAALLIVPKRKSKRVDFQIIEKRSGRWFLQGDQGLEIESPSFEGTVKRGSASCPCCGFTTPVAQVRDQLKIRRGGARDARLLCVITTRSQEQGRSYRAPTAIDEEAIKSCEREFDILREQSVRNKLSPVPDEKLDLRGIRHTWAMLYGIETWGDCFTPRQAICLAYLGQLVQSLPAKMNNMDPQLVEAVQLALALAVGRSTDYGSSLCRWVAKGEFVGNTFGRQALPMIWDFCEVYPCSDSTGGFPGACDWVHNVLLREQDCFSAPGSVQQASATQHPLPDDCADALITDPPYYDAVPYAYLSDFFYVWMRRSLGTIYPDLFEEHGVPKDPEIVVDRPHELSESTHDIAFYERELSKAFSEGRRVVKPGGVAVVVFASKTTASWEAILKAVIDAGWIITGSWPIDTEMEARVAAQGQARLASSVHLVCRPRENNDGSLSNNEIGDWREVLQELPIRIHEWMPRLAHEGVVGADAIFACLGPALEIFSRYSRVEKASGDVVALKEYLEHVWAAVSKEALSVIFEGASTEGFEPDARLTAMWLWTLAGAADEDTSGAKDPDDEDDEKPAKKGKKTGGFSLEYDAARKIAQGLGAHIEDLKHLVEVSGGTARLLPVAERTTHLFGKAQTEETLRGRKPKKKDQQLDLFAELTDEKATEEIWTEKTVSKVGDTTLDRVHQSMILFATNRGEALKRFLVDDGAGKDPKFWRLAQALSALYPSQTDEKRWVDGVLARKKGLGL